jgi:6-phosphogluconolactonase
MGDWRTANAAHIAVLPDINAFSRHIADEFIRLACRVQQKKGDFSVILGGSRTPENVNAKIVQLASEADVDWSRIIVFFSDERCVPPYQPESNFNMIHRTLVMPLGVPEEQVHRIEGELDSEEAARRCELKLRQVFGKEDVPSFDLALLGMGPDGHTASLFPHSPALRERLRLVVPAGKGPDGLNRVTLTYPVLNASRNIWFMISGKEKQSAVTNLLNGPFDPASCPAQGVCPVNGELVYIVGEGIDVNCDRL